MVNLSLRSISSKCLNQSFPLSLREDVFSIYGILAHNSLKSALRFIQDFRCPAAPPTFLGDYPKNKNSDWSDGLQGVAHSTDHWFFTQKTKIIKLHISKNMDTNLSGAVLVVHMPQDLKGSGCNHFGDPDYIVFGSVGYLFIPVEEEGNGNNECRDKPRIAVFRDDAELTYMGFDLLSKQNRDLGTAKAGWVRLSVSLTISYTLPITKFQMNFLSFDIK